MQQPRIRSICPEDLAQLFDLLRAKAEFDGGADLLKATPEQIKSAFFDKQPRTNALVAEIDDEVVGFATYFPTFSTFLAKPCMWLDDLFVTPVHRSRGIGKLLLDRLAHIAKEQGAERIDWTVATTNERGQAFYRRIGAKVQTGTITATLDKTGIDKLAASVSTE